VHAGANKIVRTNVRALKACTWQQLKQVFTGQMLYLSHNFFSFLAKNITVVASRFTSVRPTVTLMSCIKWCSIPSTVTCQLLQSD